MEDDIRYMEPDPLDLDVNVRDLLVLQAVLGSDLHRKLAEHREQKPGQCPDETD